MSQDETKAGSELSDWLGAMPGRERTMSCDRRCFDKESEWHGHEDCHTCPGSDICGPLSEDHQTFNKSATVVIPSRYVD